MYQGSDFSGTRCNCDGFQQAIVFDLLKHRDKLNARVTDALCVHEANPRPVGDPTSIMPERPAAAARAHGPR